MSSENSKNMLGMVDLSNVGDDALLYIKILFEKTQRLEKENKELKEVVRICMVGERMTPTKYRGFRCECCGASEGGQVQGCDDCEIYKVSSGMWWSKAGWAIKDDV